MQRHDGLPLPVRRLSLGSGVMSIELAIFDVDDVVIDMDEAAQVAEGAVRERLCAHLSLELADRVSAGLGEGYDVLVQQLRGEAGRRDEAHERLLSRLRWWQRGAIERGFELKVFSRHTLLAAALEAERVPVTAAIINDVMDAYWAAVRDASVILEGARWAIERCRALGAHVHLATNSDGFLIFDEAAQTFYYDPEDAVRRKRERLGVVQQLGVEPEDVSVGDPIGKPAPAFFEAVLTDIRGHGCHAPLDRAVCIGDSLVNDVLPLMALGVTRGVWLLKERTGPPEPLAEYPGVTRLSDLRQLEAAL